jgi:predicted nucleic-acid-binding Zn-ribbon protein
MKYILPIFLLIISSAISCTSIKQIAVQAPLDGNSLVYLDTYTIPNNFQFMQTTVGGLSSIDYDVKNNQYYLISDDRSAINPARFYTATIAINNNKIDTVFFYQQRFLDGS